MPTCEEESKPTQRYPKSKALVEVVVAIVFLAAGIGIYAAITVRHHTNLVQLQWAAASHMSPAKIRANSANFRTALYADMFALVPGYLIGLLLGCQLGRRVFWTPRYQLWTAWGIGAAVLAGALNLVHDALLLMVLSKVLGGGWVLDAVEALSFVKFAALLVALALGGTAIFVTAGRLGMSNGTSKNWKRAAEACERIDATARKEWKESAESSRPRRAMPGKPEDRPMVIPPPMIERRPPSGLRAEKQDWWQGFSSGPRTRWAEGFASPSRRPEVSTGVCVSGGGIRSASVTLGALHALREAGVLRRADYLVSVSGGGYTVGGLQLAMTKAGDTLPAEQGRVSLASPRDAFAPGSPEEDHLRRYSSYIANGLGQLAVALGVLLRGVLSSLIIIGLTITTLGLAIGAFYQAIPITSGGVLERPRFAAPAQLGAATVVNGKKMAAKLIPPKAPLFPTIPTPVLWAIGVVGGLTILAYLLRQLVVQPKLVRRTYLSAVALLAVTVLLAVLGVALPALLWASSWVTWPLGFGFLRTATVSSLSLVTTYLGAVAATFWRKRTTIAKTAGTVTGFANKSPVNQLLPYSMIQLILLWICLAVLILTGLLFCGWAATSEFVHSVWALVPAGALVVLILIIDQTSLSLHPFYRRQLASAFAVRRVNRDGADVAVPYGDEEMTWLSTYGERVPGFPAVTFAATANITGQARTPPGRPAVPFMLAHDYIGGPATGWVRTDFLQQLLAKPVQGDLTVEAAMAISGAAFASAMGSQTRFYEVFLAIANARLGAWLPNPLFVALKREHVDDWTIPGLPRRRRLSYFAREIFGVHPSTGRMLLCTDGGHYDNLGLVELLRRRCKLIYCIDASGASQPLADALAGAITLAREELGVEISFTDEVYDLVPGGWDQLKPAASFTDLNARLSKNQVAMGSITYPEVACKSRQRDEKPGRHKKAYGQIVFAQAALGPDVPYQLLDFPQDDAGFPHDSTGDQFFNASQFDSYQALGHFIGQKAARRPLAAVGRNPLPKPARRSRLVRPVRMLWLRRWQRRG